MGDITRLIRGTFETFVDARKGKNKTYTLVDAGLSAFSVFFMQCPSFLEHQRTLEQAHGENNARTLFGVHEIPSLDGLHAGKLQPSAPEAKNRMNLPRRKVALHRGLPSPLGMFRPKIGGLAVSHGIWQFKQP